MPNYQNINYRFQMPMMQELLKLEEEGRLNEVQKRWFNKEKQVEEFYDTHKDPYELDNLINNKRYVKKMIPCGMRSFVGRMVQWMLI